MQAKHTPGPWLIDDSMAEATIGYRAIVTAEDDTIASPSPMGEANARLIAAAPDMLAALRAVADYWAGGDVPADIDSMMRAAIARATGEV